MKMVIVKFTDTSYAAAELHEGANLSEILTIINSPVLFGCRSGICGTCLVEIDEGYTDLESPEQSEKEALEIYAPDNIKARLACQIYLNTNISLRKISSL